MLYLVQGLGAAIICGMKYSYLSCPWILSASVAFILPSQLLNLRTRLFMFSLFYVPSLVLRVSLLRLVAKQKPSIPACFVMSESKRRAEVYHKKSLSKNGRV